MITDNDVMRLLERADPARADDHAPVIGATGYLAALRTRSNSMTIIETPPTPTEPTNPRRWPMIAAAVAAVALTVVGVLVVAARDHDTAPLGPMAPATTAPDPTPPASPNEVVTSFMDATSSFDAERAASYLSDEALANLGGLERLRLGARWNQATGFRLLVAPCEEQGVSSSGLSMRCPYDYHGIRSDEIGLGPFSGSAYVFLVQDGVIVSLSDGMEFMDNGFSAHVWEPFAAWVSNAYPDDAAIMYSDSSLSDYRLTDESIALWDQHSREYVDDGRWTTQLGMSFVDAISSHDVDRAASLLTDEALVRWGGLERHRLDAQWDQATGFQVFVDSCEQLDVTSAGTKVRCAYDFQGIRSAEMGLGPFAGSYYELMVLNGAITSVSDMIETGTNGFSATVWEPFAQWVAESHPDDVAAMYSDSTQSDYRLSDESIGVWEQRSREYVDHVLAATPPTTT